MRKIKFRVWSEIGNKWIHPIFDITNFFPTEHYQVMQFTGKKDCEGIDIYEGDIIEFDRREWGGDDNIHVVTWDEYNAEWSWGGGCTNDMEWRKVIGNKYENPELLKTLAD